MSTRREVEQALVETFDGLWRHGVQTELQEQVQCAFSYYIKAHLRELVREEVVAALGASFDVYAKCNAYQDAYIEQVIHKMLRGAKVHSEVHFAPAPQA